MKSDSQANLPVTDEQYDEDIIEYESVSNADLYIYDFDTMKEYKKYYPSGKLQSIRNKKKCAHLCQKKNKYYYLGL